MNKPATCPDAARRRSERGYSLTEMLAVVAIIGIFSLISIPSFMNYNRSRKVSAATRQWQSDVRAVQRRAITRNHNVAISFRPNGSDYAIFDRNDDNTWTQVGGRKTFDPTVYFLESDFATDDAEDDALQDIVYRPNGSIANIPSPPDSPQVAFRTNWELPNNTIITNFTVAGSFTTTKESRPAPTP